MSTFEEVCLLSCGNWINSFPDEIPEHKFSKNHNKKMKELINSLPDKNSHKLSKNTIKILLIAAVLLIGTITAIANPTSREYIITKFFNHSSYSVKNINDTSKVNSIELNYTPNGFMIVDKYESDYVYSLSYSNGENYFSVDKYPLNTHIDFDTEKYDCENISINGIDAVFYNTDNNESGIIFNNNDYIFIISGNISKKELVNIAQSLA